MSKKAIIWSSLAVFYLFLCFLFVEYTMSADEKTELFSKLSDPVVMTVGEVYGQRYAVGVFLFFILANIYTLYTLGKSYLGQANRYKNYSSALLDADLDYLQTCYDDWLKQNLKLPSKPLIPAIIATAVMFGWLVMSSDTVETVDRLTPSTDGSGWILTSLVGVLIAMLLTLPTSICINYMRCSRVGADNWIVWVAFGFVVLFDIMAASLIVRTYSIWLLLFAFMGFVPCVVGMWPSSDFERWKDEAKSYQAEKARKEAEEELRRNCDIDYGGGGGGSGTGLKDLDRERRLRREQENLERIERNRRLRREKARRDYERALDNASPRDCAYYRHGIGQEGCSFGGVCGDVVGSCEYEMSPKSCSHFKLR